MSSILRLCHRGKRRERGGFHLDSENAVCPRCTPPAHPPPRHSVGAAPLATMPQVQTPMAKWYVVIKDGRRDHPKVLCVGRLAYERCEPKSPLGECLPH